MACAAECLASGRGMVYVKHLRSSGRHEPAARHRPPRARRAFEKDAASAASAASAAARVTRLGHALVDEAYPVTPAHLAIGTPTVYITCVREPVSRVISSYFFEGRMPIGGMETWRNPATGKDEKRRAKPKTLAEYIAFVQSGREVRRRISTKRCWLEVQNYLVQIFAGQNTGGPVGAEHVSRARQTLNSFDVVLILVWRDEPEHRALFERATRGVFGDPNLRSNSHTPSSLVARCSLSKSRRERAARPTAPRREVAPDDERRLRALNEDDTKFYEYAQALARFRMDARRGEAGRRRAGGEAAAAAASEAAGARAAPCAPCARDNATEPTLRGENRAELPPDPAPAARRQQRLPEPRRAAQLDADARERQQAVRRDDRRRQARRRLGPLGARSAGDRARALPLPAAARRSRLLAPPEKELLDRMQALRESQQELDVSWRLNLKAREGPPRAVSMLGGCARFSSRRSAVAGPCSTAPHPWRSTCCPVFGAPPARWRRSAAHRCVFDPECVVCAGPKAPQACRGRRVPTI